MDEFLSNQQSLWALHLVAKWVCPKPAPMPLGPPYAFCLRLPRIYAQWKRVGYRYIPQIGVQKVPQRRNDPARKLIKTIRKSPKPVFAKINGFCFTGALELALTCDLIWVADEAKMGDTHAKFGLRPTWGMSARLPA